MYLSEEQSKELLTIMDLMMDLVKCDAASEELFEEYLRLTTECDDFNTFYFWDSIARSYDWILLKAEQHVPSEEDLFDTHVDAVKLAEDIKKDLNKYAEELAKYIKADMNKYAVECGVSLFKTNPPWSRRWLQ